MEGWRLIVFGLLWLGFFMAFWGAGKKRALRKIFQKTKSNLDEAVRKRLLSSRENLLRLQKDEGLWFFLERQLRYSGLQRRFPFLSAEVFGLITVLAMAGLFLFGAMAFGLMGGLVAAAMLVPAEGMLLLLGKAVQMRAVSDSLMKLLDFLGNYSMTAGDVTSVFGQISKYMDEPLRTALEQCCLEAQTTGDVGLALLAMADKVEHPQFKELVRNIEVSCRHSADFSALVTFSRRSVRDYLKSRRERKSLLREAGINMVLLLAMSVFAFVTVNGLLEVSIWSLLLESIPGRITMGIVAGIALLFGLQAYYLDS